MNAVAEFAVDTGVEKFDLFIRVRVAAIGNTAVVRFRIDVDAHRALVILGEI